MMKGLENGTCKKRLRGPRPLNLEERTQIGGAPYIFPTCKEMPCEREGLMVLLIQQRCCKMQEVGSMRAGRQDEH